MPESTKTRLLVAFSAVIDEYSFFGSDFGYFEFHDKKYQSSFETSDKNVKDRLRKNADFGEKSCKPRYNRWSQMRL